MDDALVLQVMDHLDGLPDAVIDLAIAAVQGEHELAEAIDGRTIDRPTPMTPVQTEPVGAFIKTLTVAGFRGIGPRAQVSFQPGPGLTIVSGRNGSGKSSLAEALEFALTGSTHRWEQPNSDFTRVWRNVHQGEPCDIALELVEQGVGRSVIKASWKPDAERTAAQLTYQRAGEKQQSGLAALGWERPLGMYRPILSYEELGGMLTGRGADLFDALNTVLGLDDLNATFARLKQHGSPLSKPVKEAGAERQALRKLGHELADPRGQQAAKLLVSRTDPDLDGLRALSTGAEQSAEVQTFRLIDEVALPDEADVLRAADALEEAEGAVSLAASEESRLASLRDALLSTALDLHDASGDGPCPVCGEGRLDTPWRAETAGALEDSRAARRDQNAADQALRAARIAARQLLEGTPPALTQAVVPLTSQASAAQCWAQWSTDPGDRDLAAHLRTRYAPAAAAVATWQDEARVAAGDANAVWTPYATRLAAWVEQFVAARTGAELLDRLDTAEAALRVAERVLREERLGPIVDHAKRIWSALRQESNVDILDIDLTGQNTSRHVVIKAAVDGADAGALSVLSQGELHALALALFLPRAAMAESPFQFIILDDPVQAMDPAKVGGLLSVLTELAATHQVIVLSHDDRLAQAARRTSSPARILEVTREAGSVLTIANAQHPSKRYLDDAFALAKDDKVPEVTRRLVLPGVLRQALEAAAYQRYFEQQLGAGTALHEVEQQWADNPTTRKRVELALGTYSFTGWRDRETGRREALGLCSAGMHTGLTGDILTRIRGVEKTVQALEAGQP